MSIFLGNHDTYHSPEVLLARAAFQTYPRLHFPKWAFLKLSVSIENVRGRHCKQLGELNIMIMFFNSGASWEVISPKE